MKHPKFILAAALLILTFGLQACGTLKFDVTAQPALTNTPSPEVSATQTPEEPDQPEITETVEPTAAPNETSEVSGRLCYPSEFIPAQELYFFRIADNQLFSAQSILNQTNYSIQLEPGSYYAYAWIENYQLGGAFTEYVACGYGENCTDHTLKPLDLKPGQTVENIDICDWIYLPDMLPTGMRQAIFGSDAAPNSALSGLVVGSHQGAWLIGKDGREQQLSSNPILQVSPDGTRAVFDRDSDLWLLDFSTGTEVNLTNTPNRMESGYSWSPYLPDRILFTSFNFDDEAGPGFSGFLSMIDLEGSQYQIIDPEHNAGAYAVSPDGDTIIYGVGPQPYLFSFSNGLGTFNPTEYGFVSQGSLTLGSPAWSPDGSKIIFTASATINGNEQFGVALFDLAAKSSQFIFTYQVMGMDGIPTSGTWSPDGRWVAIFAVDANPAHGGLWVVSSDGNPSLQYKVADLGAISIWHPHENFLVYSQPDSTNRNRLWLYDAETLANKPLDFSSTDSPFPMDWITP